MSQVCTFSFKVKKSITQDTPSFKRKKEADPPSKFYIYITQQFGKQQENPSLTTEDTDWYIPVLQSLPISCHSNH